MVFVLDLDEADSSLLSHRRLHDSIIASSSTNPSNDPSNDPSITGRPSDHESDGDADQTNPNLNGFSAALGCYPYALQPCVQIAHALGHH
jgi:hypothetical protein